MFEEEEEEDFQEGEEEGVEALDATPTLQNEVELVLEGKRWADGGYIYGYDVGESKKSRLQLKKSSSSFFTSMDSISSTVPVEDISTGAICPVSEDVIAIHNRTHIKFVFLRTGKSRLLVPNSNQGVGVIGGRDDLGILAWSDIGPPSPQIHVYRYADPLNITSLKGDAKLEYIALCFNHDCYLIGLSGVPDYKLTLWNWKSGTTLHSMETSIGGPTNLSFCPSSGPKAQKLLLTETFNGPLSVWTVKKCGNDMRLLTEPIPEFDETLAGPHITATWAFPSHLFILTSKGAIFKTDYEKKTTKCLLLDETLERKLKPPIKRNVFIKANFEGLLLIFPDSISVVKIEGLLPQATTLKEVALSHTSLNLQDFHLAYRFIGWTPSGNILQIQSAENSVVSQLVWERAEKKRFVAAAFIQPASSHFAALDINNCIQLFSVKSKEEAWHMTLPMECRHLLPHPKLPIFFVLTADGRILSVAVSIKILPPPPLPDEDSEFSGDDEEVDLNVSREPIVEVSATIFDESRVHAHELDFGEFDNLGHFLVVGGADFGKIFLCDIQVTSGGEKITPPAKSSTGARKPKFQPSFEIARSASSSSLEGDLANLPIKLDEDDGDKYLKICCSSAFEGHLLDLSFVNKTIICLTSTPSEEPGAINEGERVKFSGDMVAIFMVDKGQKSLQISCMLQLKMRCSGICLSENAKFFFTVIQRRKILAKFKVMEQGNAAKLTPTAKADTEHQMDLHKITKARSKAGYLALFGRDGFFSYHSANLEEKTQSLSCHFFHHDTGGLWRCDISSDGSILAVNQTGSLQLFQPKDGSRRPSSQFLQSNPPLLGSPRTNLTQKTEPFVNSLFERPKLSIKSLPEHKSWDEKQEEARVAIERKRYEASINEVSAELESMRAKVAELLAENDRLPESERMDVHEFELDVDEQQRRVNEGLDKEDDLRFELKAWQLARQKVGQKIRKKVWDDMEVKGRSIIGITETISVANYPMVPMTFDEMDALEEVLAERKLAKEIAKASGDLHGNVPQLPPIPGRPLGPDTLDERIFGSKSYEFVDVSACMPYSQLEVTTRGQAKQQIIILQEIVRKLKRYFNAKFDELYDFKEDRMHQINDWRDSLKNVLIELGNFEEEEMNSIEQRLEWSPKENPELDLPPLQVAPEDLPIEDEDAAEAKRKQFKKTRSLPSREFEVEGDIAQPEFMATKSMVDYAPAEISAVEQYEALLSEQSERKMIRKRQLEVDRVELKRKIREAVEQFDARLLDLYKMRLAIEKCILAEELKILLYDRRMAIQDQLDREESSLLNEIREKEEYKETSDQDLIDGRRVLDEIKAKRDQLYEIDKSFEKNFKKEFPGLGFNQLEALMKCFRKRPKGALAGVDKHVGLASSKKDIRQDSMSTVSYSTRSGKDLKTKSIAAALERMSNMFRGTMLKKTPAAGVTMAMSLDELDRSTHCPENVDEESWKHLCDLRRKKIVSEENIQALDNDIYETDMAVCERDAIAEKAAQDLEEATANLETWRKDRNYKLNNTEILLAVPHGQLEVKPQKMSPYLSGSILITESMITKLNQDIQRLGESKLSAMTESKDFRSGTRLLQWEKEKLTMEHEDLLTKWTEIQQTKLTKESRHALQAGEHINRPTLAQEYAILDRAATASETYLKNRLKHLEEAAEAIKAAAAEKEAENARLEKQLEELNAKLQAERETSRDAILFELVDKQPQRMHRIVKRNRMIAKIKEQQTLMLSLQEQFDTYMHKSFPSLG